MRNPVSLHEQIIGNLTDRVDLSSEYFSTELVRLLADDLAGNTSVKYIAFQLCSLIDEKFYPICDALIKRAIPLDELDIKHNDLTEKSIPVILDLMKIGIKKLDISYNPDITDSDDCLLKLSQSATVNGVGLILGKSEQSRLEALLKKSNAANQSKAMMFSIFSKKPAIDFKETENNPKLVPPSA